MWSSARIGEPAAVDRDGNKADRQFHSCCLLSLHFYSWQRIHFSRLAQPVWRGRPAAVSGDCPETDACMLVRGTQNRICPAVVLCCMKDSGRRSPPASEASPRFTHVPPSHNRRGGALGT